MFPPAMLHHNAQFDFQDLIHDQNADDVQFRFGRGVSAWYNGCGPIATFNAALLLGHNIPIVYIVASYEGMGGALADGMLGLNPAAVPVFFQRHGFETSTYTIPTSVDEQIREAGVGILTYAHSTGGHQVAVRYSYGRYFVFNAYYGQTGPLVVPSIDAWLQAEYPEWRRRNYLPISLTTIR